MSEVHNPMDRDISCVNFMALINHVSTRLGKDAVDLLLSGVANNKKNVRRASV